MVKTTILLLSDFAPLKGVLPVLAKQRDWDVLKATGGFLSKIGAKEQAANLRTALAGED